KYMGDEIKTELSSLAFTWYQLEPFSKESPIIRGIVLELEAVFTYLDKNWRKKARRDKAVLGAGPLVVTAPVGVVVSSVPSAIAATVTNPLTIALVAGFVLLPVVIRPTLRKAV